MRPLAYSSARELTPAPGVATVRMHGPRLNPTSYNKILRLLTVLSLQPSMEVWPSEVRGTEPTPYSKLPFLIHKPSARLSRLWECDWPAPHLCATAHGPLPAQKDHRPCSGE